MTFISLDIQRLKIQRTCLYELSNPCVALPNAYTGAHIHTVRNPNKQLTHLKWDCKKKITKREIESECVCGYEKVMFLPQKIHSIYSKCFSPLKFIQRTAKMSNRKKYISKKPHETNTFGMHLQVIGSGAADQPAIIALNGVDKCYLFNCGEGIGRHCQEANINLTKISNIFFTQSKWNCIGGVTSVIFATVAFAGYPPKFHGPKNLPKIIQRMIFLSSLGGLFKHRFEEGTFFTTERFEDNKIVVQPIALNCENETAMLYVCKVKARPGGFSLKKSVEKNVPAALLPKLYNGEAVTLDDGTVVKSTDVRFPDMPEANMICTIRFFFLKLKRHE